MRPAYSGKKWLCTAAIGLLVANVAGVLWQKSAAQNHAYGEAAIQPDGHSVRITRCPDTTADAIPVRCLWHRLCKQGWKQKILYIAKGRVKRTQR